MQMLRDILTFVWSSSSLKKDVIEAQFRLTCSRGCMALGELSPLELRKILARFGIDMPDDLWSTVVSRVDTDGDGMVQIGEFMKQMKHAVANVAVSYPVA